jgi:hypothetical protein
MPPRSNITAGVPNGLHRSVRSTLIFSEIFNLIDQSRAANLTRNLSTARSKAFYLRGLETRR